MDRKDFIVLWAPGRKEYDEFVGRYAARFNLPVRRFSLDANVFKNATHAKYARMGFIFNGLHGTSPLAARMLRRRGIPVAFFEWGMLPQGSTYFIDTEGFCGDSVLMGALDWVTPAMMDRLYATRAELQRQHPIRDEGFVLLPNQIHNDTQVLYFSPYQDMLQVADDAKRLFPGRPLVVRPHPKSPNKKIPLGCLSGDGGSFLDWAARASAVVAVTSTCLWEAAILGKPVTAIGDHPLAVHRNDVDRACAAALFLTTPRAGDPAEILEHFGVRPLGCSPLALEAPCSLPESRMPAA